MDSIEACIANERKATNGSLDFQAFGFPKRSLLMQVLIKDEVGRLGSSIIVLTTIHFGLVS